MRKKMHKQVPKGALISVKTWEKKCENVSGCALKDKHIVHLQHLEKFNNPSIAVPCYIVFCKAVLCNATFKNAVSYNALVWNGVIGIAILCIEVYCIIFFL